MCLLIYSVIQPLADGGIHLPPTLLCSYLLLVLCITGSIHPISSGSVHLISYGHTHNLTQTFIHTNILHPRVRIGAAWDRLWASVR